MPITKLFGRFEAKWAKAVVNFGDVTSGVAAPAIHIPVGAIVTNVLVTVDTAFNSVTSDVISVGDGVNAARYVNGQSVAASGAVTTAALANYAYPAADSIDVTWTGVGTAPTAGKVTILVEYVEPQEAEYVYENPLIP